MRLVCVVFVTLISSGTPGQAHWQYTKWGMTPQQVEAASTGTVRVSSDNPDKKVEGFTIGNEGSYSVGSIQLSATFYYKSGGLQMVKLSAESDPTCFALGSQLGGQYGEPSAAQNAGFFQKKTWKDGERGNRVEYFSTGDYCTVTYSDLTTPTQSAL